MYEILKDFAGALATIIAAVVGFTVIAWQTAARLYQSHRVAGT
jgi:hypothetical protein